MTSKVPAELYYLEDGFRLGSLRKFQLKQILDFHGIPVLDTAAKTEMEDLVRDNIFKRRDEILTMHKNGEPLTLKALYGRGCRESHKRDMGNFVQFTPRQRRTKKVPESMITPSPKKDKDGFAIPEVPERRAQPQQSSSFNPEDSFEEDNVKQARTIPETARKTLTKTKKTKKQPTTAQNMPFQATRPVTPSTSDRATRASAANRRATNRTTNSETNKHAPSFNPEDSFAESADEGNFEPETHYHEIHSSYFTPEPEYHEQTASEYPTHDNLQNEEDESDDDYVYGDETDEEDEEEEDDDEEDLGDVDKEELVQLYKEQYIPAERLAHPHIKTRAQKFAAAKINWRIKLKRFWTICSIIYIVVGVLGLSVTSYARNKNGYCPSIPTQSKSSTVTSYLSSILPSSCIPCPDHGHCADGELTCDSMYKRRTPIYNIAGKLPIADDCIRDSKLGKYVAKVEREIKRQLAKRQGEAACKYFKLHPDADEDSVPIARIPVDDVMSRLQTIIEPYMPPSMLKDIMLLALTSVLEDSKVLYWEIDEERFMGSKRAKYPLTCQIKRLNHKIPQAVKKGIVATIWIIITINGITRKYRQTYVHKRRMNGLVKLITDRLKEQYEKHVRDPHANPSPAIPVSQLRSAVVDVNDSKTLNDWQHVADQMVTHPHIRRSFTEERGDLVEYWELTA